jgi:isocitrate dehydrogenase
METTAKITYTITDEAPALATAAFLPIVTAFSKTAGITVESKDISLAGRIISAFPGHLKDSQKQPDDLALLGKMVKKPDANIIKLPNISASIPQMKAAINELQSKGYALPDYPEEPDTDEEKTIKETYDKIKGSAVNPVLREGNSDRRAPASVKAFAKANPHSMGEWTSGSKTHVASMTDGDFFGSEQSILIEKNCSYSIVFTDKNGNASVLRENAPLLKDEIIDASRMSVSRLRSFLKDQIEDAKKNDVLLSIHMKATMMKVSDPVIFGHMVSVYYEDVLTTYEKELANIGFDCNNGIGDLYSKINSLSEEVQKKIKKDIDDLYSIRPPLAMVDSDKGITNLHVPSDIIIDASMPAAIRNSGKMWGPDGKTKDMKAVIPDRSYSSVYQETIDYCKEHGAFDPANMGSVSNVGLMAQKAEEYGSHDKTFIAQNEGTISVIINNETVMSHTVEKGDIWRMCQVKDAPVRDWVKLAVNRAKITGAPAVFWLDENRAHDSQLIKKVYTYLKDHDTKDIETHILSPKEATRYSLERISEGLDTISVTGNVLRDYLTDLFPILEVGTSAKMLSIVPLMNGGGLFETGAGGSAPKHVQQLMKENHLRWDSLGEFLALAASYEHLAAACNNKKAALLGKTLDKATASLLTQKKSPSRKVNEIDNRGSQFHLTLHWAEELAAQDEDPDIKEVFSHVAKKLSEQEETISDMLIDAQGVSIDLKGYYKPDSETVHAVMRPCSEFNSVIDSL